MTGYTGTILEIDLSTRKVGRIATSDYAAKSLGGRGMGVALLQELLAPNVDPLGPENVLVLMTGPLTGTLAPSSGRIDVVTKSPETGLLGGGNAGGFWGPELKWAGYDGIVIRGRADNPVYIEIHNDSVTINDATELWGLSVPDTVAALRSVDPEAQVACIGPAGENLVNLAAIAFGTRNFAARGGIGAVMGAKNLKAIVVRGTRGVRVADAAALQDVTLAIQERIEGMPLYREAPEWHWKLFLSCENDGKAFYGNYDDVRWPGRAKVHAAIKEYLRQGRLVPQSCFGCPLRCWAHFTPDRGNPSPVIACQGTLPSVTYFMKLSDPQEIWNAYQACQALGLDSGGTSAVLAFGMDLYERGIITKDDTSGLDLSFGNGEAARTMIEEIAHRRGFGAILGRGVKAAAAELGPEAMARAVYAKGGLELWLMEMRPFKGVALASAVTDSGSHNRATYAFPEFYYRSMPEMARRVAGMIGGSEDLADPTRYEGKARLVIAYEDMHTLADSLGVCSIPFQPAGLDLWAKALHAVTGIAMDVTSLMHVAARIRAVERLINLQEGLTRENDSFSARLFTEPLKDGPWAGEVLDRDKFEAMKDEYFSARGWDEAGVPTPEELSRLGLGQG